MLTLKSLKSLFKSTKAKQARPRLMGVSSWAGPTQGSRSYVNYCQEGYAQNVIIYRAVNLIAQNLASVPWQLKGEVDHLPDHGVVGAPLDAHPLQCLIDRPNPLQSRAQFMETLTAYLLLAGNAYVELVGEEGNQELYLLRPDRVTVEPGPYGIPKAYLYEVEGAKRRIPVDPETGRSSILHLKFFHPLNDWYGLSPLEAMGASVDQHNAVGLHNLRLLENGGRPTGALVVKPQEHGMPLNDEQRTRLKEDLETAYGGAAAAGKMMILEGDMDWREMGLSPKDLDFLSGKYMTAREMAQAFGVPPMLVGVPGDATFANYREARFHLWEDTILPLLSMIMAEMNAWLVRPSLPKAAFCYNLDAISALAVRRDPVWERLKEADFLTLNEKREALGYARLPEGDVLGNT